MTGQSDQAPQQPPPDGGLRATPLSRRLLLTGAAAVAVAGAGGAAVGLTYRQSARGDNDAVTATQRVDEGQTIAEFAPQDRGEPVALSGTTLTGDPLDLADLRGDVVVVNVWGSWCPPCREEAPVLARASADYAARDVSFVGVNVKDNRPAALAFEDRYGITYPSIDDSSGQGVLALSAYVPAAAVPVTLVLDRQGRVAARVLGTVRESTLRALLDAVLAEPT